MKTGDYILTNATELFNRQGFTGTSLRQVAAYLDMSDGNLRYHFRNKEELLMAIYSQMLQDMEGIVHHEIDLTEKAVLAEVRKQFQLIFYLMYQYRFLFIESTLLLKDFPKFRKAFQELFETRKSFFLQFFRECKARNIFNTELDDQFYEMLYEQIFIISDNWIKYLELDSSGTLDQKINHYIDLCMGMLKQVSVR